MIKHKNKIIFCLITVVILVVSFFWGNTPTKQSEDGVIGGNSADTHLSAEEKLEMAQEFAEKTEYQEPQENSVSEPEKQAKQTEQAVLEDNTVKTEENTTCYISVSCDSVLENMGNLKENKRDIIPSNGIIFKNEKAVFYEGESVFNVLARELKKNKIHFEYTKNPMYNSVYIEGIGNLYEFDCGELSGWVYKVNGKTPGCGCSQYTVQKGDEIEFIYTCNMGIDVGGYKDISGE